MHCYTHWTVVNYKLVFIHNQKIWIDKMQNQLAFNCLRTRILLIVEFHKSLHENYYLVRQRYLTGLFYGYKPTTFVLQQSSHAVYAFKTFVQNRAEILEDIIYGPETHRIS